MKTPASPSRPFPDGQQLFREHPGAAALSGFPSAYAALKFFHYAAAGPLCYKLNGDPYVQYFDPRPFCYQDGGQFYRDDDTGGIVADYCEMVSHDHDTAGAHAARQRFLLEHGHRFRIPPTADALFADAAFYGLRNFQEPNNGRPAIRVHLLPDRPWEFMTGSLFQLPSGRLFRVTAATRGATIPMRRYRLMTRRDGSLRKAESRYAQEIQTPMKCTTCKGTGAEFPGNPRTEKCEECNGTGQTPQGGN